MCEILDALRENDITLSSHYYGTEDLATSCEIKEIIDNSAFFDSFYTNYPLTKIETINDFIIYLFSVKFNVLSEMVPNLLQEEHKELISTLSAKANDVCKNIEKGDVIKFINSHIEEIFTLEDHIYDIRDTTFTLIKQYTSGIKPHVYSYLCANFYWLIIANFDSFYRVFKMNTAFFEMLYPTGHLSDIQERGFNATLDIFFTILSGDSDELKELVNNRMLVLFADMETLVSTITEDNVKFNESVIREFTSFLQHIKHPRANEFAILYKHVEEILFKWIDENGTSSQYEIPIQEIIEQFSKTKNWMVRLLQLTHSYHPENAPTSLKSRLDFEKEESHHLMDFCSSNLPTDDYFTRSHQIMLSIHASVGAGTMIGILSRPKVYQDYAKLVMSALIFISDQIQRDDEHLRDDWALLDQMIQTIIANRESGSESLRPLCYSVAMFACSLMEKILRLYYVDRVKGELYVPIERSTLGQLLTENNTEIVEAFGSIHVKHLAFFMLKSGDKKIGQNYRNRLAHWTEIKSSSLTVSMVAELLWLFTDVINTVFLYYINQMPPPKETETTQ